MPFILGDCYRRLACYEKAIENYQRSVQEYPEGRFSYQAPYWIGLICKRYTKDYQQAVYWLGRQRELYPEGKFAEWALSLQAATYFKHLGDYKRAAEAFEEYLAKYPEGLDKWFCLAGLARCYAESGDPEGGLLVLQEAYDGATSDDVRDDFMRLIQKMRNEGGAK